MSASVKAVDAASLLSEAHFFLHAINIERRQLVFVPSGRELLSRAAFIDGRSNLATSAKVFTLPFEDALAWYRSHDPDSTCDRLLVHTAFCGSTLLARALDHPNYSFVYKEPQALIDLVTMKQAGDVFCADDDDWSALLGLCLQQFRKSWSSTEVSVLKPSNWVNILLPDLVRCSGNYRAVLLTGSPRDFLLATIRGGRDRFAYVLKFFNQIQLEFPSYAPVIHGIDRDGGSGLLKSLKYCALAYHLQLQVFDRICADAGRNRQIRTKRLKMDELLADPVSSVKSVAQHLKIDLPEHLIVSNRKEVFSRYSKDTGTPFEAGRTAEINNDIEQQYCQDLDMAIRWYETALPAS